LNNDVVDTGLIGILVSGGVGVVVEGNRVSNSVVTTGAIVGIQFAAGNSGLAINNRILRMAQSGILANSPVFIRDNILSACFFGAFVTDLGNNQCIP
jgi:hypothetical protein